MTIRPLVLFLPIFAFSLSGCYARLHFNRPDYSLSGSAHPHYDLTDIGPAYDLGINNKGQIVGESVVGSIPNTTSCYQSHAPALIVRGFLWENGKRTKMRTFGGWGSEADKITDQGQVLGYADVPGPPCGPAIMHRCYWDGTNLMDLEADPRFRDASDFHITATGAVYVVSPQPGTKGSQHLWLYPAGFWPGAGHDQGIIGGSQITVHGINDNGMVIGTHSAGKRKGEQYPDHHAFVWWKGKTTDLGTFGGGGSGAKALNNAGQVVGAADIKGTADPVTSKEPSHAFLWEKGKMHDLGTLPGGNYSGATGINDKGQIVGESNFSTGNLGLSSGSPGHDLISVHPVLWESGHVKDLTQLIPAHTKWSWLDKPTGINDKGQIVGQGDIQGDTGGPITVIAGGLGDGYLLTPR